MSLQLQKRRTMGISNRSTGSIEPPKLVPKFAAPLFLPSGDVASNPQQVADVWRHHFAKDFDHRIRQVPFEMLEKVLCEACRVAGKAYWCQLAEIVKQVIKCNRFPDVWKGGIMCGIPRKPRAHSTPEHSRGILISTAPCTLVGKALNKRVTQVVEATSKSWQIGCRPGFGTELPSLFTMEFLAMCKQQQRPAAILFADFNRSVLSCASGASGWSILF